MVEMTAGILVCCMPTTAAVLGQLKGPVSSILTTSRKNFKSFARFTKTTTTTAASGHEELGSTSNLRPPYGAANHHDNNSRADYEMQKPWSGAGDAWGECRAEPETRVASPLEGAHGIRKSTKVEVKRGSGGY